MSTIGARLERVVLLIGACIVYFFGIETCNRSLEDIEAQQLGERGAAGELRYRRKAAAD